MSSAARRAIVDGAVRKVVKRYGVVDGINRKIYKGYVVVGGINRLCYISEALAYTGEISAPSLVDIDGVTYDLYTLTTSGSLSIYADNALFWLCGGGAGGRSAASGPAPLYGSGGGGGGAYCTLGELTSGKYPVEIGKGGTADTDGSPTTLGTFIASGGKTGTDVVLGGNGGTGGGGGDGSDGNGLQVGAGGTGDGVSTYPFGLTSLYAHCAGGGGGTNYYSKDYSWNRGGDGGSNGSNGRDGRDASGTAMWAPGGEKGGGHGGGFGTDGADATFYGSGGGGGGKDATVYPFLYGKGGSGYQGVVYIAIPHKQEPLIIIRQPEDVTAVVNGNASFSVAATGEGLTYQWQALTNGATEWVDTSATGNKTSTVSMTTESYKNGYQYRCIITDMYGVQKTSNVVTLTVVPILITKQPEDFTGVQGDTVVFSVEAEGNGLIYQWEYNTGNGWNNNTINETAQTSELSFIARPYHNGYKYRCLITDANGNTLRTDEVTMTVPS